jgi:hypothetical protein
MDEGPSEREGFHEWMDAIFQALPPRDSDAYLRHLREASTDDLPAHVLVRVYRELADPQLADAGPWVEDARNATTKRLIRRQGGRSEYLWPAVQYLLKRVPHNQYFQDLEDLLQDTLAIMLQTFPTKRGSFGEKSWYRFAKQCAYQAWAAHVGRKGEHQEPLREEPRRDPETGVWSEPLERVRESESEDNVVEVDVHQFLSEVIAAIPDPLIRAVGEDQWLSGDPSPDSGKGTSAGKEKKPALERQFGVSRDRIIRAQRFVEARILAELENRGVPERYLAPYRRKAR